MPCRGTGRLISMLGGTPSTVTCPWCRGGGVRLSGADAQARWRHEQDTGEQQPSPPDQAA
jgi:hypothetical protein